MGSKRGFDFQKHNSVAPLIISESPRRRTSLVTGGSLSSIWFSEGHLVPAFRPHVGFYALFVDPSLRGAEVEVTITTVSPDTIIYVDKVNIGRTIRLVVSPRLNTRKIFIEVFDKEADLMRKDTYVVDLRVQGPFLDPVDPLLFRANATCEALASHELSLDVGDIVMMQCEIPEIGWALGCKVSHESGWFPLSAVERVLPDEESQDKVALQVSAPQFAGDVSQLYPPQRRLSKSNLDETIFTNVKFTQPTMDKDADADDDLAFDTNDAAQRVQPRPTSYYPVFTIAIIIAQLGLYIASLVLSQGIASISVNPMAGGIQNDLITLGATWPPAVSRGNVHRLLIGTIVPTGAIQLCINLIFHIWICLPLERALGPRHMSLLYIMSGFAGNIVACIFLPTWLHANSSPSVLGVVAGRCLFVSRNGASKGQVIAVLYEAVFVAAVLFVLGVFPGGNNFSNAAGVFAGLLFTNWLTAMPAFMLKKGQLPVGRASLVLLLLLFTVAIIVFYTTINTDSGWCDVCRKMTCIDVSHWCDEDLRLLA